MVQRTRAAPSCGLALPPESRPEQHTERAARRADVVAPSSAKAQDRARSPRRSSCAKGELARPDDARVIDGDHATTGHAGQGLRPETMNPLMALKNSPARSAACSSRTQLSASAAETVPVPRPLQTLARPNS